MIHLDTHVVAWLYAGMTERLSGRARELLQSEELAISPVVELELQYLHEIGRLRDPGALLVEDLRHRIGLSLADTEFARVVATATRLSWTRDPFDRLITAQALAEDVALLTADTRIRVHCDKAIWD